MFTTFSAHMSPVNNARSRSASARASAPRQKRRQVTRACDACRTSRIKCDDQQPCRNCRHRGEACRTSHPWEAQSLSAAKLEIERLQRRVIELEQHASRSPSPPPPATTAQETQSPRSNSYGGSSRSVPIREENVDNGESASDDGPAPDCQPPTHDPAMPYAASSFTLKLSNYLEQALNQPYSILHLEPTGVSQEFSGQETGSRNTLDSREGGAVDFSRAQEGHFLSLIWQHVHCICPILDEDMFHDYYDSLWANPRRGSRRPSALVDSLLALCMQLSSTFLFDDQSSGKTWETTPGSDACRVGQPLYHRSHRLLLEEQQAPTLQSVQTLVFSTIYLMHAARLSSAHAMLGVAIRMARVLGLHHDPSEKLSIRHQELRRRVWWSLSTLDGYLTITMGLTPHISPSEGQCSLPADAGQGTVASNPELLPENEDITWFSFHVQYSKLVLMFRSMYALFQGKQMELLQGNDGAELHGEPGLLESVAGYMNRQMKTIQEWVNGVPASLRLARKGGGPPFSFIDSPSIQIETYAPLWLQRQRFSLEISYHHLNLAILRPFLRFKNGESVPTLQADSHSVIGLQHAITLTSIVNQALTESEILIGCLFVFRCQWDATLYLLGFMVANPVCPFTPEARRSISTAIHTFTILERYLSAATSALSIVHEILGHSATLINQCREALSPWTLSLSSLESSAPSSPPPLPNRPVHRGPLSWDYYSMLPGTLDPALFGGPPDQFLGPSLHTSFEPSRDPSSALEFPRLTKTTIDALNPIIGPSLPVDKRRYGREDPDTEWVQEYSALLNGWQSSLPDAPGGAC
ncbi:hypothetical protein BBP40_008177 [Aspergillus hancockii]|nr:hypothetical protein BBP40_008177 [Aspergillus hancockii]